MSSIDREESPANIRPETRCVIHSPDHESCADFPAGSVVPMDPSTAYEFVEEGIQPYPRYFNTPNQVAAARTIADLEHAESGLLFASGMAAISTAIAAILEPGDHAIFLSGLYGGTHSLVTCELPNRGIEFDWTDGTAESIAALIRPTTRLVYVETPTNPCLRLVDLSAIAKSCREAGAQRGEHLTTMVDNTFASPIVQNPIDHGFDLVVHSGTKYLGGHSDLCCGAVVGPENLIDRVRQQALLYGGSLNAQSAFQLERSLKTLAIRVERQNSNALALARWLNEHELIQQVHYPGLPGHAQHELATRQMRSFGAMLSFELSVGLDVIPMLQSLRVIRAALSLGGVDSSMCVPATTSHRHVPEEELRAMGVSKSLVRFSVGIEHIDDLQHDLDQALAVACRQQATSAGVAV